jgi:thiamine pyrophosphokinase
VNDIAVIAAGSGLTLAEAELARRCAVVIAVDRGYKTAVAVGCRVDRLVGDLDSLSPPAVRRAEALGVDIVRFDIDKDESDLELALAEVARLEDGATVHVFGIGGGRPDHAAVSTAVLAAPSLAGLCIITHLGDTRLHIVHSALTVHEPVGTIVSLLAHGGVAEGVTTTGLRWPLADATLRPDQAWGLSNEVTADPVTVHVATGTVLVYVTPPNAVTSANAD